MADLTFGQEIALTSIQVALPIIMLIGGGRYILSWYETKQKKREQEIELLRFVRERQYETLQDTYKLFGRFMYLYRELNSADVDLTDIEIKMSFHKQCAEAESQIESLILRIASEFKHENQSILEKILANLRQSVQLWRESVRESAPLPFDHSEQADYVRFKNAFSNTVTFLASQVYQGLDPADIDFKESNRLLNEIFSNKWERNGAHI